MKTSVWLSTLAALLLAPAAAMAAKGYVVSDVALRAGPDTDFPRVSTLDSGTHVSVLGCIDGWAWCDVVACDERGWVAGRYVELLYEGRHVYLHDYGPRIGVPVVTFSVASYWNEHYHDQPWYGRRDYWVQTWSGPRAALSYSSTTRRVYTDRGGAAMAYVERPVVRADRRYAYRGEQGSRTYVDVARSHVQARSYAQTYGPPGHARGHRVKTLPASAAWGQQRAAFAHEQRDLRFERRQMALEEGPPGQRPEHRGRHKEHKNKYK